MKSKTSSIYQPHEDKDYQTAAAQRLPRGFVREIVWDPSCGEGHIAHALMDRGHSAILSDIKKGGDFQMDFIKDPPPMVGFDTPLSIVTRPPMGLYGALAVCFIQKAIKYTMRGRGNVFMLLPADFDFDEIRKPIFADHPAFSHKLILTQKYDREGLPQSKPRTDAWYFWDWEQRLGEAIVLEYL